uniref:Defective in cullin neddylation protein n=1 Tax=Globodera pallida TaxID=36090 RepID=A0A183CNX3_GLOPA
VVEEQIHIDSTDGTAEFRTNKTMNASNNQYAGENGVIELRQKQQPVKKNNDANSRRSWDLMEWVEQAQQSLLQIFDENQKLINAFMLLIILFLYHALIGFALFHNFNKAATLFTITVFGWLYVIYQQILSPFLKRQKLVGQIKMQLLEHWTLLKANAIMTRPFGTLDVLSFRSALIKAEKETLADPEKFNELYQFVYSYVKLESESNLELETAVACWEVLLEDTADVRGGIWVDFLRARKVKDISWETWNLLLKFLDEIDFNMGNYDEGGDYPELFDDFVKWCQDSSLQDK